MKRLPIVTFFHKMAQIYGFYSTSTTFFKKNAVFVSFS